MRSQDTRRSGRAGRLVLPPGMADWTKRVSWGDNPTTRTASRWFSKEEVQKHGRCAPAAPLPAPVHASRPAVPHPRSVFYNSFYLDGVRIRLNDCVGVALEEDDQEVRATRGALCLGMRAFALQAPADCCGRRRAACEPHAALLVRRGRRPRVCWSFGRTRKAAK